ncbi:unnamed protein product [Vicia faba]|uniref:Uncharacterized protein n=1 Tax=Vicia faba TaxID=3906 RepID=A0AAV1BA13_VICFA|nr:unnamed protein product [Vicia faba]
MWCQNLLWECTKSQTFQGLQTSRKCQGQVYGSKEETSTNAFCAINDCVVGGVIMTQHGVCRGTSILPNWPWTEPLMGPSGTRWRKVIEWANVTGVLPSPCRCGGGSEFLYLVRRSPKVRDVKDMDGVS